MRETRFAVGASSFESRGRRLLAILLPAAAAAALPAGGCASEGAASRGPWHLDSWSFRHREDPARIFAVNTPLAVDVESFGGDVIVEVDETLTEATVTVTREATHGPGREGEAKASLDQIDWTVELASGDAGPALHVRASTAHPEPHFQRAHVRITLPHADGLHVRTQRGRVRATDVAGIVDVETSDEDVRVMTNYPMTRPVTIVNRHGDVDYRVRGESSGAIDARTVRGRVSQRVRHGRLVVHSVSDDAISATLNDGENPVILRTVDGDIRIAVVEDPTAVGARIVQP